MVMQPFRQFKQFVADESGSNAIEYALLATVVAITAFGALQALGGSSGGMWGESGDAIMDALQNR